MRNSGENIKKRLGNRIVLSVFLCMAVFSVWLVKDVDDKLDKLVRQIYSENALTAACMTAALVDGDKLQNCIETGEQDTYYEELVKLTEGLKDASGAAYMYLFYPQEDYFVYLIDVKGNDKGLEEAYTYFYNEFGDIHYYTNEYEKAYIRKIIQTKKCSEEPLYGDDVGYGKSISMCAPVLDSEGAVTAIVEVDYLLVDVENNALTFCVRFSIRLIIGSVVITALMIIFIWQRLSKPLNALRKTITSYEVGNGICDHAGLYTGDDIEVLFRAFAAMVERIEQSVREIVQISAEKERISAELDIAKNIQRSLLPNVFPPFPDREDIDLYAFMMPAKEVGGDLYDFFLIEQHKLVAVIADVSGKGVPAAMFMAITRTMIKNQIRQDSHANKTFERINNLMCENNAEGFFVTAWIGILDLRDGLLEYANAGHNPPVLLHADGSAEWIAGPNGLVLAAMEDVPYASGTLRLEKGDRLFLYTDGVTEAMNENEEMFTEARLEQVLCKYADLPVRETIRNVYEEIKEFSKEVQQYDDITMLELVYK